MPLIAPKYSLTWLATGSHEMDQFHILNVRNEIHFWIKDFHSRQKCLNILLESILCCSYSHFSMIEIDPLVQFTLMLF